MSPEVNGNPPSVTKRKKKQPPNNFDLSMPSCNYFPQYPYPNFSVPDMNNGYYRFMNPSEPMSLPVYPLNYSGYTCPGGNMMGSIGNLSNQTFNISSEMPDYLSLPVVSVDANEDSKRRFSDPGLPNDSDSGSNSCDEMVHKLNQQINVLKENNNRLSREVMELRIELNLLKQQQVARHYEREYEPGMLADVIREVREAARVREDALFSKVKHIMEEKQLNVSHLNLATEKSRNNNDRIAKLEEQLKNLTIGNNPRSDETSNGNDKNKSTRQVLDLEREALELRRELQDTRAKKEEADQKVARLSNLLRRSSELSSDHSEDGKTSSVDSFSTVTSVSSAAPPRVVLSGPVTSL